MKKPLPDWSDDELRAKRVELEAQGKLSDPDFNTLLKILDEEKLRQRVGRTPAPRMHANGTKVV